MYLYNRQPAVLVVTIIYFTLGSLFVILRAISRIGFVRRLALDDYLMFIAWLIDLGFSISIILATNEGLGLHDRDIKPGNTYSLSRSEYVITVLYNPALMAVKTSILTFYLTLTQADKVLRYANYAALTVVNIAGLALTMVNIFQCRPLDAIFRSTPTTHASCTDIVTLYLSSAPINLIVDLTIFFLPLPILTRMHLPLRQKIILVVVFGFGAFTAVVGVIRVAYLQSAATSRAIAYQNNHFLDASSLEYDDFSWYAAFIFMWSAVEVNTGIICASAPILKPLAARVFPGLMRGGDESDAADASPNHPRMTEQTKASGVSSSAGKSTAQSHDLPSQSDNSHAGKGFNLEDHVDLREFLATSDPRTQCVNASARYSRIPNSASIVFVNFTTPTSMLKMSNLESIPPVALTTILFFMWGFAYGLLDVLNSQFQAIVRLDSWASLGLHGAYYGGYLVGPLTIGRFVLITQGFKATFITGLCLYACGTLIFWPSAVLMSYPAFVISNFVVGLGLAILETAANPFIALCGPPENSEVRLNFSQGVQAVGSVISPLLAKKVLFKDVSDAASLVDVQWTYLGIAMFDVLLAVIFYYLPIPEASDEELRELADRRREANAALVGGIPVVWLTLALGVFSQWCYVGGQEAFSTDFEALVTALAPSSSLSPFNYLLVGHTLFALGRFLAAFTQCFVKPRLVLLATYLGMIVSSVLCIYVSGSAGVVMGLLVYLFESGAFSTIFAISLRGTAEHTKTAAACLATAISSAIIFPFPQNAANSRSVPYSFSVTVAIFSAGAIFPVYLNLVPAARKQVDPIRNEFSRSCRNLQKHSVVRRMKENPASGGVLSRRRSLIEEPLAAVQLSHVSPSDDPATSGQSSPTALRGGIAHELAPWPNV